MSDGAHVLRDLVQVQELEVGQGEAGACLAFVQHLRGSGGENGNEAGVKAACEASSR